MQRMAETAKVESELCLAPSSWLYHLFAYYSLYHLTYVAVWFLNMQ